MLFAPMTLATGYILAGLTVCPAQPKPAEINIMFKATESPYVTNVTSRQLTDTAELKGPDSTASTDGHWMVGGLTQSQIGGSSSTQFQSYQDQKTGNTCLYVTKVDYQIFYNPVVYIASDFRAMGCRYSATVAHEKRHVSTDVRVITDTIPVMKKMMAAHVAGLKPVGPFPVGQLDIQKKNMAQAINDSLLPAIEQLKQIRRQKQAAIDTIENYKRDTALCPGQFPKFDGTAP